MCVYINVEANKNATHSDAGVFRATCRRTVHMYIHINSNIHTYADIYAYGTVYVCIYIYIHICLYIDTDENM